MTAKLNQLWRLIGTGFTFAIFGILALVVSIILMPILQLVFRSKDLRRKRSQLYIHYTFRTLVAFMRGIGLLSYETHNLDKLQQPGYLIIANHPSFIDVVFLISFIPEVDCIIRANLFRNVFTRRQVKAACYIANTNPQQLIDDCVQSLQQNHSLIVFPEGTRSKAQQAMQLQRGAANIALRAECDILPVFITCQPATLGKHEPWYKTPKTKPHWSISVHEPILIAPYLTDAPRSQQSRKLTADIKKWYLDKLPDSHPGAEPRYNTQLKS